MQAEGLRQVRAGPASEGQGRLRMRVEAPRVLDGGEGCVSLSLIEAPGSPGRTADGGSLGQLPGAERSFAGAATLRPESYFPPTQLRPPPPPPAAATARPQTHPATPLPRPTPVFRPHSHPFQELQGKVMEAAAALDASRGGPEL